MAKKKDEKPEAIPARSWFATLPGLARTAIADYKKRNPLLKSIHDTKLAYELILDGIKFREQSK